MASALSLVGLTGCSGQWARFGLPEPASEQAPYIGDLWFGFWVAALVVGVIVWALILWAVFRYRRREGDKEAPRQTKYHLPLELLYTLVPFLIIGVLFLYTMRASEAVLDMEAEPDLVVDVIGQKWSWTFNYHGEEIPGIGVDAHNRGTLEKIPDLYLPVNKTVKFNLDSADVIHSFWVPAFYFKLDVIPGHPNSFQVTPNKVGVYDGKCAELCGEFHSAMLFKVHVVEEAEFHKHVKELAADGQTGHIAMPQTTKHVLPDTTKKEG
ncbi:cytochrome c oxidase subunit II [Tessaracoccus sp. OH4464_COT-324]|uniref:aa3-type cytochrome oxidase subunit II n=1 Tax=Tessaracoccus sp. OH4464_COT-324 TaxID=2491059 RepID=UPI003513ED75